MVQVFAIDGVVPVVDPTAYVHPTAILIGDVIVGPRVYVGPAASLRGDFGRLVVEAGANIQDTCVLHGFVHDDTVVGPDGHVGHGAVLHGCRIARGALIGMNAVVMDDAVVGEEAIVAAMSFVKAGFEVPPRSLVAGIPAKIIREVTAEEIAWKAEATRGYQNLAVRSLETMTAATALAALTPERERQRTRAEATVQPLSRARRARD